MERKKMMKQRTKFKGKMASRSHAHASVTTPHSQSLSENQNTYRTLARESAPSLIKARMFKLYCMVHFPYGCMCERAHSNSKTLQCATLCIRSLARTCVHPRAFWTLLQTCLTLIKSHSYRHGSRPSLREWLIKDILRYLSLLWHRRAPESIYKYFMLSHSKGILFHSLQRDSVELQIDLYL